MKDESCFVYNEIDVSSVLMGAGKDKPVLWFNLCAFFLKLFVEVTPNKMLLLGCLPD